MQDEIKEKGKRQKICKTNINENARETEDT